MRQPIRHERSITIFFTIIAFLLFIFVSIVAFMWALADGGAVPTDTAFWFIFAFLSGLLTIFLPCTLPLAFVTIPISRERHTLRALGMILLFALGVGSALTLYGGALGALGALWVDLFPPQALTMIIPWVYFLGGLFAYILSLGELGLVSLRMPTYVGKSPDFMNRKKGTGKMFYVGLFLGNIGVGCPFPAIPLLLISAVLSGSALYGVLLFLIHAIGRVFPLLVLMSLTTIGVNSLAWLTKHKSKFDNFSGWLFVVFTALLITVGSYSHEWIYSSMAYTSVATFIGSMFPVAFVGSVSNGEGIFAGAFSGASTLFLFLILLPLWWGYSKERRQLVGNQMHHIKQLEHEIGQHLLEQRGHKMTFLSEGKQHERILELDKQIDVLLAKRKISEEGSRYGAGRLESKETQDALLKALYLRRNWYVTLTILIVIIVYSILS